MNQDLNPNTIKGSVAINASKDARAKALRAEEERFGRNFAIIALVVVTAFTLLAVFGEGCGV